MSELRVKMNDDMILRGLSDRTRDSYLRAVRGIAKYYRRSPDRLTSEEVQRYLLHLYTERKLAKNSCNVAVNGLRFFYRVTLQREEADFDVPYVGRAEHRVPDILSQEEVTRILSRPTYRKHRILLMTAYAAGLRVSELVGLRVTDIDSLRGTIHVVQGKGARDRYVPLSECLLSELRGYWREERPRCWLFPGSIPDKPLSVCTPQTVYRNAKREAGVRKHGGIHALRHAFATHMLEAGVDLYTLMHMLGHRSLSTTACYLHLAQQHPKHASPLDLLRLPRPSGA